ncbi:MAG: hypothetical protein LPJ98_09685, partial [Cyclobacteriaceae bacterium]|nr:hypothetical protein [Cyclobacteriaceae bacterium]
MIYYMVIPLRKMLQSLFLGVLLMLAFSSLNSASLLAMNTLGFLESSFDVNNGVSSSILDSEYRIDFHSYGTLNPPGGNVRVKTNSGTISIEATFSSTTTCNTGPGIVTNNIDSSNPGEIVGEADKGESLFLKASPTNSDGVPFSNWITNDNFTTPDPSKPNEICVEGKNGMIALVANYCYAPSITSNPTARTITYGDANPTFSVTATGASLSY